MGQEYGGGVELRDLSRVPYLHFSVKEGGSDDTASLNSEYSCCRFWFVLSIRIVIDIVGLYSDIDYGIQFAGLRGGGCVVASYQVITTVKFSVLWFGIYLFALLTGIVFRFSGVVHRLRYRRHLARAYPMYHPDHYVATVGECVLCYLPMAYLKLAGSLIWINSNVSPALQALVAGDVLSAIQHSSPVMVYFNYVVTLVLLAVKGLTLLNGALCWNCGPCKTEHEPKRDFKQLALGIAAFIGLIVIVLIYFLLGGSQYTPRPIRVAAPQIARLGPGSWSAGMRPCAGSCASCPQFVAIRNASAATVSISFDNSSVQTPQPQCTPDALSSATLGAFCNRTLNGTTTQLPINVTVALSLPSPWQLQVGFNLSMVFPPAASRSSLIPAAAAFRPWIMGPTPNWTASVQASFGYTISENQVSEGCKLSAIPSGIVADTPRVVSLSCGTLRVSGQFAPNTVDGCIMDLCIDKYGSCFIYLDFPLQVDLLVTDSYCPQQPTVYFGWPDPLTLQSLSGN